MSMKPSDSELRRILGASKCIAVVGLSPNETRPSFYVARYLKLKGYRIVPVNPGHAGKTLLGEMVYASLADIPDDIPVDMVDIFRRSEQVPEIVEDAIAHLPSLRTIWMQIGVDHAEAAARAAGQGLDVVQNLCPKMEHQRLFGELRKAGFNTGMISSKLQPL